MLRAIQKTQPFNCSVARSTPIRILPYIRVHRFSTSRYCCNEQSQPSESAYDFPWLLTTDKPRIEKYPYEAVPLLPLSLQKYFTNLLGANLLKASLGQNFFPEQFLAGAGEAVRQTITSLSDYLNNPEDKVKKEQLQRILSPSLLERFVKAAPSDVNIGLHLRDVRHTRLGDIWTTMGNPATYSSPDYSVVNVVTVRLPVPNPDKETFTSTLTNTSAINTLTQGLQINVDVLFEANVTYKMSKKGAEDDILIYDEGVRTLRVRFGTPYFIPAKKFLNAFDETGEPIPNSNWSWRIIDIDQLLEKESMLTLSEETE
ncbi:hypothetical protein BDF20DRAFT_917087 [Mycotypha africana]|uniref:uncharacterized protein n=1 Tax=Mycotypha africana TaxID=64632 RepID=UPI00230012E6|nr:uncharacterized protein BDF20DRAFT_917087 [Mycotypha africana]KAI8968594.1 hypothetical protein BDF20DRAFT_917087 [Mycotypha africana]